MFWNRKKKYKDESEEDLFEYTEDLDDEDAESDDSEKFDSEDSVKKITAEFDEDTNGSDEELEGYDEEFDENDTVDGEESTEVEDEAPAVTVAVKVGSLNSLAEFVSLRHPMNLQFMRKGTNEVFEIRESHLRIARVWGTVSMSRECSATEYAKIMLALELLEDPDGFYVLPALTEGDLKKAITEFCEEKYDGKSKKYANNPKKFMRLVESNGDKEEWELFLKEQLYKKTADFCDENGIEFSEPDEEENNE